jgi:hypothetical protein
MTLLLDAALSYHRRGWTVIPTAAKKARFDWKQFQSERPSEGLLEDWFGRLAEGTTGLAVVLGAASGGLAVRDYDDEAAYQSWVARHAGLASTLPTARTGRGFHVYFRTREEVYESFGDGELRGDCKHYVLAPPSLHPSGTVYRWTIPPPEGPLPALDPAKSGLTLAGLANTASTANTVDTTGRNTDTTPCNTTPPIEVSSVVSYCVNNNLDANDPVDRAIRATVPSGPGQRNRAIFEFVRRIKAMPEYREAKLLSLIPLAERWYRVALPFIRTKDIETTLKDFANAWKACTDPNAGCFVEAIFEEVKRLPPHPVAKQLPDGGLRLMVGLCAALQRYNGDKPFILGCRTAGRLLGVSHEQANRWIQTLEAYEIIRRTFTGTRTNGKASEFLFVAEE